MSKQIPISLHFTFQDYKNEEAKLNKSIADNDQVFSKEKMEESLKIMEVLKIGYFNTWIHSSIYTDFSDKKEMVKEMEKILNKYPNIRISSLHYNGSIFDLDEEQNIRNREQMEKYVELIKKLRPNAIVVHPGVFGEGGFAKNLPNYQKAVEVLGEEKVKELVADNLRHFGKVGAKYNIKIAVENIFKGRVYSKIPDLISLIEEVNLENVGYCLDIGHAHYDEVDIVNTIRLMKEKLFELHLSDNAKDRDAHLPIGFGTINWIEIIKALKEIEYKGTATFEFFRWPTEDKEKGIGLAIEMWKNLEKIAENNYHTLNYL
jgi:sugar phosphate isomerase/epimerase